MGDMVRKVNVSDLEKGMYVCGFEKEGGGNVVSFVNNILVRDKRDIKKFYNYGYRTAYVLADKPLSNTHFPPVPPCVSNGAMIEPSTDKGPGKKERERVERRDGEGAVGRVIEFRKAKEGAVSMEGSRNEAESGAPPSSVEKTAADSKDRAKAEGRGEKRNSADPLEYAEEIKGAKKIRDEAMVLVTELMTSGRAGAAIPVDMVHETVGNMVESIFRNRDALTSLVRLKSHDGYTFTHSVNVCILSISVARHMGFDKQSIHDLGVGAVLHDVGKTRVPESILNKNGPLTDEEFREMKRHTVYGHETLVKTKGVGSESATVALEHHERYNGMGYPGRLRGKDIHVFARIAAVSDVYDAMTSERVYQKGMLQDEALQRIYTWRKAHFDSELVERFIKCVGIYPIGTLVEFNTGEMGVVRGQNPVDPLKPRVLVLFDSKRSPLFKPFEVDLKTDGGRCIVSTKDPVSIGVSIDNIIA